MRILQVADFYWPFLGGVEQHVRTLSSGLADLGHEVHVATLRTGELPTDDMDGDVRVHRIPSTSSRLARLFSSSERPWAPPVPDPESVLALWRLVRELRPDVVHGHDWLARSYLPMAGLARRRFGTRYVTSLHYYTLSCAKKNLILSVDTDGTAAGEPCPGPTFNRCIRCSAAHYGTVQGTVTLGGAAVGAVWEKALADDVVAVSRATASGNRLDPTSVDVVANPVGSPPAPSADDVDLLARLPERFIMFVGDLRPMKGLDVLFDAYELLRAETGRLTPPLVAIGKRWPDTPASVPAGAMVFDRWPNSAVLAAWERALVGVVPSVWDEPFGIVAVEALRGGTPVVASAVGGLPEIIRAGRDGVLVPRSDPRALADALRDVLTDETRRRRMSASAHERSRDFDVSAISRAIESIYLR